MATLGTRVKRRRLALDLTQWQLADAAGVPQSMIAALESGARQDVRGRALKGLARALGVSIDYLMDTWGDAPTADEAGAVRRES
jgi:transcriptional regulator with XRE-family HTH domain